MILNAPTALHFTCHMRLSGCIAPPHSQLLCASRRESPALCHAVPASQPSASARIDALKQQYQGLLAPIKAKPAGNTAGRKSTQSSRTAQQKGNSPSSNAGSAGKSASDSPVAATQHSRRNRSDASAGRKPAHGKAVTSNTSSSRSRSSSSNSSSKASRDSQDKQKPSNSGISKQTSQETPAAAPAQNVSLSGKGFGTCAAGPPSSSSTSNTSSSSISPSPTSSSSSSSSKSSKATKLFRFGVEAAAIQKVIQQNGWEDRVEQVEQLSQADVLVAVKCTPGGRHQNLQQGERAAANANIPFIVIGRRLSKEQFYKALSPHLGLQTPDEWEAATAEAEQAGHDQAFADQWFKTASRIKWASAVPAAATNAAAALQQRSQQQTVAAQMQVHKQQQQQAAVSGRDGRSSSSSRRAIR